jgi:hypothetical protein
MAMNTQQTDKWATPTVIDDATMAFPASVSHLMPSQSEIPADFHRYHGNRWLQFQSDWFFKGIKLSGLRAKDGIDLRAALRHLGAIQGSFEPKHEHKTAAVAYLASRWLDDSSQW